MANPKTLLQAIQYFSDEQVCIDAVAPCAGLMVPVALHAWATTPEIPITSRLRSVGSAAHCRQPVLGQGRNRSLRIRQSRCRNGFPLSGCWSTARTESSYELATALGVPQKSAWFMLHRIRLLSKATLSDTKLGGTEAVASKSMKPLSAESSGICTSHRRVKFAIEGGHTGGALERQSSWDSWIATAAQDPRQGGPEREARNLAE